jgi:hypothetical protein
MLEVRRWNEGKLSDFSQRLEAAHKELGPKSLAGRKLQAHEDPDIF